MPALRTLRRRARAERPKQWDDIIKIGRTHLADATPIRLGQEFGGFAAADRAVDRPREQARAKPARTAALGGTAVGTGINTPSRVRARVSPSCCARDRRRRSSRRNNHFEAQRPARRPRRVPRRAARPSPSPCSRSPTTSAGSAPARAAASTKSILPDAAARLLDHAGQGQPGHVRVHDAGRGPRDRQRRDASRSAARPRAISS